MRRERYAALLVFMTAGACAHSFKPLPYISPGLRVGYEFGKGLSVGVKISLGIYTDPTYYNITFGARGVMGHQSDAKDDEYEFIEFQAGYPRLGPRDAARFGGAGAGIVFLNDGGAPRIRPIFNLSYGAFLFLDADIIPIRGSGVRVDAGAMAVLPVPLERRNWFD